jgi:hypothetical protein
MSFLVSSRKRIYVLLLFWQRLKGGGITSALGAGCRSQGSSVEGPDGRLLASARMHRRLGHFVVGFTFLVIAIEPERESPRAGS